MSVLASPGLKCRSSVSVDWLRPAQRPSAEKIVLWGFFVPQAVCISLFLPTRASNEPAAVVNRISIVQGIVWSPLIGVCRWPCEVYDRGASSSAGTQAGRGQHTKLINDDEWVSGVKVGNLEWFTRVK